MGIIKFLQQPVTEEDGSPVYLDNGKPVTVWGLVWRGTLGVVLGVAGLKGFLVLYSLAVYLEQ